MSNKKVKLWLLLDIGRLTAVMSLSSNQQFAVNTLSVIAHKLSITLTLSIYHSFAVKDKKDESSKMKSQVMQYLHALCGLVKIGFHIQERQIYDSFEGQLPLTVNQPKYTIFFNLEI